MDSDYGIIPFTIGKQLGDDYYYQREIMLHLINGENIVVLKSRRVGLSWIAAAYVAWGINFRRGWNALFVSKGEKEAISLLRKVKFILSNLAYKDSPDIEQATLCPWLCNNVQIDNQTMFAIGHSDDYGKPSVLSSVQSLTTTKKSGIGEKSKFVFIDEVQFIDHQDELFGSVLTTAARNGHWMLGSNSGMAGTRFHHLCLKGKSGENKTYWYREVWPEEAGIDQDTIDKASETYTEEVKRQEWYLQFAQSGSAVFNSTHLAACYKPLDMNPDVEATLEAYRQQVLAPGNSILQYYSGVDSAVGKNSKSDYNCFTALTANGVQAFCHLGKEALSEWAGSTMQVGGKTIAVEGLVQKLHAEWPGLTCIEENGPGYTVINQYQLPHNHLCDMRTVNINQITKSRMIKNLILAIETHAITITDAKTYQQMSLYQSGDKPDTYSAPKGFQDDACLKAGTLIKTKMGYKPVEIIKPGELVLTHTGEYHPVIACVKRQFNDKFYTVKGLGQLPLQLSFNHPLYAATNSYEGEQHKKWANRKWVEPGDFKKSYGVIGIIPTLSPNTNITLDYTMFYELSKSATNHKLEKIILDAEFAKFLGLFLAEGTRNRLNYRMSISLHKDEINLIEFSKNYLGKLDIPCKIYKRGANGVVIEFSSKFLSTILSKCYDATGEKALPDYAYGLGQDLQYTLEYWMLGDGWISGKGFVGATTSKSLALEMRDIALACGLKATIQTMTRHRYGVPTKRQYWVNISSWTDYDKLQKISDFEVASKAKTTPELYNGYVYDLQVEGANSFIADGIVVHNCMALAMAWDNILRSSVMEINVNITGVPVSKMNYEENEDLGRVFPSNLRLPATNTRLSSYSPMPAFDDRFIPMRYRKGFNENGFER